jgi:hypothetical protein
MRLIHRNIHAKDEYVSMDRAIGYDYLLKKTVCNWHTQLRVRGANSSGYIKSYE